MTCSSDSFRPALSQGGSSPALLLGPGSGQHAALSMQRTTNGDRTQTLNDAVGDYAVTILAVRPHPDDETSLTGGMLAHYSARGVSTAVVTCTGGEEAEIHDPDLDPVADFPRLREIRERELRDACAILGVSTIRLLGYRDSGMLDTPGNQHRRRSTRPIWPRQSVDW